MNLLGCHADLAHGHVVFSGHEAKHGVKPVVLRGNFTLRRRQRVHRDDARARDRRPARVGHVSADAARAGLRHRRRRGSHDQGQAEEQMPAEVLERSAAHERVSLVPVFASLITRTLGFVKADQGGIDWERRLPLSLCETDPDAPA